MYVPPGSRVTVQWSDGRQYSATIQTAHNGWYGVRFDGQANLEWVPPHACRMESPPTDGMAAAAAHGVPVYADASTVIAMRAGVGWEEGMLLEYDPERRRYPISWTKPSRGLDYIDPWAVDPRSHFGLHGRAAQEERNNPTVPVNTHVAARSRSGRMMGGTIIKNDGERLVVRWDGARAREYITKEQIVQMGGVAPPPPPRPGELGLFAGDPTLPPTEHERDWYPDGDTVWAQYDEDEWWYEATVASREWVKSTGRGFSIYTIDWADGFGRTTVSGSRLRSRGWSIF